MSFNDLIPKITDELPHRHYEMHHILWNEISVICKVGKRASAMSAASWWHLADKKKPKFYTSKEFSCPLHRVFDHKCESVEFMSLHNATDTLKGIFYEVMVNIQKECDVQQYFEALVRLENRVYELVQDRKHYEDAPEIYQCEEYFGDNGFNADFAFDMDAYFTTLNNAHFMWWKLRDIKTVEVDSKELFEKVTNQLKGSTDHYTKTKTEETFYDLVDSEVYRRIYQRKYAQINNSLAKPKNIVIGVVPDFAEVVPQSTAQWLEEPFLRFAQYCILLKMGNNLTFDKIGRDPVKELFTTRAKFYPFLRAWVLDDAFLFHNSVDLYAFAHFEDPEKWPMLQ